MKKITTILTLVVIVIASQNAFAYEATMSHWANIRDSNGEYIFSIYEGENVEVLGISSEDPERTLISYNGISGSVLTQYIEVTTTNITFDDYDVSADNYSLENNNVDIECNSADNNSAESNNIDSNWAYNPSGIYSKVTTGLIIRDKVGKQIGAVSSGESVEVIMVSPINSDRMVIYYNGICGSVLSSWLEKTYADNDTSQYFEDGINSTDTTEKIEDYSPTGIFSKVTTNLTLRDESYNVIGSVPKGAAVEVIQQSSYYSDRMVVQYNGLYGSVLSSCLEKTYADNDTSQYFEDGINNTDTTEKIEDYSPTGIFSKVTTNLTLRDESYNVIGSVPKAATVEVIQLSSSYPDRMVVKYDGKYGSVLSEYIESTYADNVDSPYFEDGTVTNPSSDSKESEVSVTVDKTAQKVYVKSGQSIVLESDCVTGTEGRTDTPSGSFSIYEKDRNRYLEGYNMDGKFYSVPVKYWMPFNLGVGLHDSTREKFGGSIFQKTGSLGCVNLPENTAKQIYSMVKVGTPVYVK